jgi:hypothetical protein
MSAIAVSGLGATATLAQASNPDLVDAVRVLANLLETGYVIPEVARRYSAMLRRKLADGAYVALTDPRQLASQLTADLYAVSPDRHLRVIPDADLPPENAPTASNGGAPGSSPGPHRPSRKSIEDAGWIAKDTAYIRFTAFSGEPSSVAKTAAFMAAHVTATTLIIDCRYNGGGGTDEMNAILPYLYTAPTRLVRMEVAASIAKARGGTPFDRDPSMRLAADAPTGMIARDHFVVPRMPQTPLAQASVYYLTSAFTASAAEHLALAFRHTHRAVQIGETTAGANHFGGFEHLGSGLAVFLPIGRTVDPDTGMDWEAIGIAPDIAVAPDVALQEALRRAGVVM